MLHSRLCSVRFGLLATAVSLLSTAFGSTITVYQNGPPTSNQTGLGTDGTRSDVAPIYGSIPNCPNPTCSGSTTEPFISGDQFAAPASTTINSVTVYEVSNTPVGSGPAEANSNPNNEFSSISLYLGADGAAMSLVSSSYTPTEVAQYESIYNTTDYYIWKLTFSGLSFALPATGDGLYDFAINAVPNSTNTFALLMVDPNDQSAGPAPGQPDGGYLDFFKDANGGTAWIAEEQYCPGPGNSAGCTPPSISGFTNPDFVDVFGTVQGTAPTPEPGTVGLVGMGLGAALLGLRRRVRG
jgi:hypothetical protein